jgi:hypothetical protein
MVEPDDDFECCCDWPETCGGMGGLLCMGCGGDFCICLCGGDSECWGCPECNEDDYGDDDSEADHG